MRCRWGKDTQVSQSVTSLPGQTRDQQCRSRDLFSADRKEAQHWGQQRVSVAIWPHTSASVSPGWLGHSLKSTNRRDTGFSVGREVQMTLPTSHLFSLHNIWKYYERQAAEAEMYSRGTQSSNTTEKSHAERVSQPVFADGKHRLKRMHTLFKWDERISWQPRAVQYCSELVTPLVTGDLKNPTSHKMSSAQRQRKTGQPVISMILVATRLSERVLSFLLVLSLCLLGVASPACGADEVWAGSLKAHLGRGHLGVKGPKCDPNTLGSRLQESWGSSQPHTLSPSSTTCAFHARVTTMCLLSGDYSAGGVSVKTAWSHRAWHTLTMEQSTLRTESQPC